MPAAWATFTARRLGLETPRIDTGLSEDARSRLVIAPMADGLPHETQAPNVSAPGWRTWLTGANRIDRNRLA